MGHDGWGYGGDGLRLIGNGLYVVCVCVCVCSVDRIVTVMLCMRMCEIDVWIRYTMFHPQEDFMEKYN
jgi:hypothetical protein